MYFPQDHLVRSKSWESLHPSAPAGYVSLGSIFSDYPKHLSDGEQARVVSPAAIEWLVAEAKAYGGRTSGKKYGNNTWSRHGKVAGLRLNKELGPDTVLFANGKFWAIKDNEQIVNRYRQHLRNVYEDLLRVV
jgi:hypothetical protein